jgi:hypothetical protein
LSKILAEGRLHCDPAELEKVLQALPADSQTRTRMLRNHAGKVLQLRSPSLLDLVKKETTEKGDALDLSELMSSLAWGSSLRSRLIAALGDDHPNQRTAPKVEVTEADKSYARACVELVSDSSYLYYLGQQFKILPGLYDLSDAKAFIEAAEKEIGPGKPGLAKLAWIALGPEETKGHRADAAAAMLRSGHTDAVALFRHSLPYVDSGDYKKLVEGVKDNKNGSLFALLERRGLQLLRAAPKEVMDAVQGYVAAGGEPNKKWLSNLEPIDTARQLDDLKTPEASAAALWLLKESGPELLTHLGPSDAKYLKSRNLDLATLGIDVNTRAVFATQQAKLYNRYWTDPYYLAWNSYNTMPEQLLFALRAPGSTSETMVYDDAVLEAMRSHLLEGDWTPKLLEAFIKRAVGLSPEWAQKLRDVFPKPAGEKT